MAQESYPMTQADFVKKALLDATDKYPNYNKSEIITVVSQELDVKRSTIRRIKRELLIELNEYVRILK